MLVERRQQRGVRRVGAHQRDHVHQVLRAERAQCARVGLGADVVIAEELAAERDQDGVLLVNAYQRPAMADDIDDLRTETGFPGCRLMDGPVVLRVVRARRHQNRELHDPASHSGFQRLQSGSVAADDRRTDPRGRQHAAIEHRHRRPALRAAQRQTASRIGVDVVRMGEGQREGLSPAGRHPLIEGGERGCGARIAAHHIDDVDEIGLAQQPQRPRVGVRAEPARAEQLAPDLDDDRFAVAQRGNWLPVPHDVDDARVETDGERFQLVQRPLEGLIVLARRRQDGQLRELTSHRRVEPQTRARPVQPQRRGARGRAGRALDRGIVGRTTRGIELFAIDRRQTAARHGMDVVGELTGVRDRQPGREETGRREHDRRLYPSPHDRLLVSLGACGKSRGKSRTGQPQGLPLQVFSLFSPAWQRATR